MKIFLFTALLSAGFAVPAYAGAQTITEDTYQQIADSVFQPVIKQFDIPGLAVGMTIKGQHFIYTSGYANQQTGAKITDDTIFELGSISKLFTVTLAALAQQQGKLDLQAPVSHYNVKLAGGAFDRIKLIDLATHTTSGLPLQVPSNLKTEAELMTWLQKWQPVSASPMRSYSNVSIGLLGQITAKTMGVSYSAAVEGTLFPMLGLSSTYINVPKSAEPRYAYGYDRKTNRPLRVSSGIFADEAYGAKSTAKDMLKFLDISLGHTDNVALRKAVETTQTGFTKTEFYTQNMLWESYPWPVALDQLLNGNSAKMVMDSQPVEILNPPVSPQAHRFLNKTGATNGFGGYVALLPSEDIGIVVLANRNYPNEERVKATYQLLEQLGVKTAR